MDTRNINTQRGLILIGIVLILLVTVVLVMVFSSVGNDDNLEQSLIATASAVPYERPKPVGSPTNTLQPTPTMLGEIDGTVVVPTESGTAEALLSTLEPTEIPPTNDPNITIHVVSSGDTLYSIAVSYGVTVQEIIDNNPDLTNPSAIYVGQEIRVPVPDTSANNTIIDESGAVITETPYVVYVIVTPVSPGSDGSSIILEAPNPVTIDIEAPALPSLDGAPGNLNGVPDNVILQMSPEVVENVRQIYLRGQALGRNPQAFSKVGDSTIENPHFVSRFDSETDPYNLGDYEYLQGVIDYFTGSYARDSIAVRVGLHSWSMFDQFWAPNPPCLANEGVFECEIRIHNPSVILIRLGSNDAGVPEYFRENVTRAVEYAINNGVIPVLGTKADRIEGDDINNGILREIAAEYKIPLWDWDAVASTIPGRGLLSDGVHMTTFYLHDYTQPQAFQSGHTVHSLSALIMLDGLLRSLIE